MEGSCLSGWNEDHGHLQPLGGGGGGGARATPDKGLYGEALP